jgi:hypothetical protein
MSGVHSGHAKTWPGNRTLALGKVFDGTIESQKKKRKKRRGWKMQSRRISCIGIGISLPNRLTTPAGYLLLGT